MICDEIQPFLDHPEGLSKVRRFHEMEFRVEEDRSARFYWILEFHGKDGTIRRFRYVSPDVCDLDFLGVRDVLKRAGLLALIEVES